VPVTNFFRDGDNLLQEYDDAGNTTAQYSTEPSSFGSITSQRRSGQSHYYHHDPIGSTTELTDPSGNVSDSRRYKAFGELVEQSGATSFPFQYIGRAGYYFDPERGTYYVRGRDYAPEHGRWLSGDPLDFAMNSFSHYVYSNNNPSTYCDPSGLFCCLCAWNVITAKGTTVASIDAAFVAGQTPARSGVASWWRARGPGLGHIPNSPQPNAVGFYTFLNEAFAIMGTPIPAGTLRYDMYLFFITADVCETILGDCAVSVSEIQKLQTYNATMRVWETTSTKTVDHGTIVPRYGPGTNLSIGDLKPPHPSGCRRRIVFTDMPGHVAKIGLGGGTFQYNRMEVFQRLRVIDQWGGSYNELEHAFSLQADPPGIPVFKSTHKEDADVSCCC
jgi:RHS repeat-associated protein